MQLFEGDCTLNVISYVGILSKPKVLDNLRDVIRRNP